MPQLRDPAFYLVHLDGDVLETDVVVPDTGSRRPAFFLYSSIAALREFARLSGTDLRRFNIMSFETLEHVEEFVQQHRDFYEWVVINPSLGQRTGMEPFEQLVEMARGLVAEEGNEPLRDPAFYIESLINESPLRVALPEGVTMPVFSSMEATEQWMRAYELGEMDWTIVGFFLLNEVRAFVADYEPVYQYITINPVPDSQVPPVIQPFRRLLEIATSIARQSPQPSEVPIAPDTDESLEADPVTESPVAIQESIRDFARDYPDPDKTAFIMMEFGDGWEHATIAQVIKDAMHAHGITAVRADDRRYNDNVYGNVQTYMHGCGIGIAVYERINADAHNPNVALEVGYMLALRKPVCLLKDKTLPGLHADLGGLLYDNFDTRRPQDTIPPPLAQWISDKRLV